MNSYSAVAECVSPGGEPYRLEFRVFEESEPHSPEWRAHFRDQILVTHEALKRAGHLPYER